MPDHIASLPFWKGFSITSFTLSGQSVSIRLEPCPSKARACGHCAGVARKVHDVSWRTVRDLPVVRHALTLEVAVCRVKCDGCGRTGGQRVSWFDPHSRVAHRLAAFVALWSERIPLTHVCQLTGLHWSTVRQIHRQALQRKLAALPEARPKRLVMDEFALFKGHRYATVVLDADSRQVLWVGESRSREAIRPFFVWLDAERCRAIEVVAMDMNTVFDLEVQQQCPNARVVYDLFHVIAKYGRVVIDQVRVDEANRLRDQSKLRQVVKRSRWLLLRNRENVPDDLTSCSRPMPT